MSPGLVTQLVTDKPQIAVISDRLDLSYLKKVLSDQGLDLKNYLPIEVTDPNFSFPDETYKIVWLCQPDTTPATQKEVITYLRQSSLPVVVVILGFSPIKDQRPLFQEWRVLSQQQQETIVRLQQELPQASVVVAQDGVFDPARSPIFKTMTQLLSTGVVVDPEISIYPQEWKSFSQSLARVLVKPGSANAIVRGKKVSTSTLAKLVQLYTQRTKGSLPSIESMPAQAEEVVAFEVADNFATYSLDDLASSLIRIVSPEASAASPTALPTPSDKPQPTIKPKPTPVVAPQPTPIPPKVTPAITHSTVKPLATPPPKPTDLDAEVNRLFQTYRSDHKVKRVKNIAKTTVKTTKKNKRKSVLFKGGVASIFLAGMVVLMIAGYWLSTVLLKQAVISAIQDPRYANTESLTMLSGLVKAQNQVYGTIFDQSLFSQSEYLVNITQSWPELQQKQQELEQLSQLAYLQAVGRQTGRVIDTASQALIAAQAVYELIGQNQAWLKQIDLTSDPKVQSQISDYTEALNIEKKSVLPVQQLQPLLSQLLGAEGKRTYAVLFQNPQELRPTGGFIQAVALLTFDQGVLINTQVVSSYELDTRVAGAVQPPLDLNQLLGEQQWYFRDSNWHADFPTTATQVTWFIEKGLNQNVDGVIGLNAYVLRDLLREIGPVELPEYNEIITDRNIFERLEFHSELQLVDPQKDYSTLLFNRILQKMSNIASEKAPAALDVLRQNFESKQMTMSLKDETELATLTNLGWSGALLQPTCPVQLEAKECIVDTVAQVESNVGVNKANSYVERTIEHDVQLSEASALHKRVMTFKNTATSNSWPKGAYKNYLRLYVSPGAQLQQVLINGTPLPASQIINRTESNKQVFGFLVEIPIQSIMTVEVDYTVPHEFSTEYAYALFNQQQPGIQAPPLTISLEQSRLDPAIIAPQANVVGDRVIFETLTLPHSFVGVSYK